MRVYVYTWTTFRWLSLRRIRQEFALRRAWVGLFRTKHAKPVNTIRERLCRYGSASGLDDKSASSIAPNPAIATAIATAHGPKYGRVIPFLPRATFSFVSSEFICRGEREELTASVKALWSKTGCDHLASLLLISKYCGPGHPSPCLSSNRDTHEQTNVVVYEEGLNPFVYNWGWNGLYLLDSEDIAFAGKKSVHSQVWRVKTHAHIHILPYIRSIIVMYSLFPFGSQPWPLYLFICLFICDWKTHTHTHTHSAGHALWCPLA